jgi:outer membrane protein assembly factor BamB
VVRNSVVVAAALLLVAGAAEVSSLDWPRWRGPEGTGISRETEWEPKAVEGVPKILWNAELGAGYSSVAVRGGLLYTIGNDGRQDTVYCLEAETGKKVWTHTYPCGTGGYPGPRTTPTIDGDRVYTLSREGHLFCFDAKKGKVQWQKHLVKDFGARPPGWDFAGSPVVEGELLVLNAGQAGIALNKQNGRVVWSSAPGTGGYATPVMFSYRSRRYAAIFGATALYAVDLQNGKIWWSYPWITDNDVNAADPMVVGDKIFISTGYNKGCALISLENGKPEVVWQNRLMRNHFSSSVYLDGYIYGSDGQAGSGYLRCMDFATGKEMWGVYTGMVSLIASAGKLIVMDERGTLSILEATPKTYAEIARAKILRSTTWTPPVLSNGLLYCRNVIGDLLCIDMRK